jgi:hypothetical protein
MWEEEPIPPPGILLLGGMLSTIIPEPDAGVEGRGRTEEEAWTRAATRAQRDVNRKREDFMIVKLQV